jgi:chromosome segregation ATPase
MDNKLSEPSDNITDTLNSLRGWKQLAEAAEKRISALLAELEAKAQCITGLERYVKELEATLIAATDEVADLTRERDEARAKLATPVRLSELCGDGENDNEYTEGLNDGINQSAKAIRAAGFKCVGDE